MQQEKARQATTVLAEKAGEAKEAAISAKKDITDKLTELDRMLKETYERKMVKC